VIAWETLLNEFRSQACRCGRDKQAKQYFCGKCYFALPDAYRRRLWIPWARLSQTAICTLYTRCVNKLGLQKGGELARSA